MTQKVGEGSRARLAPGVMRRRDKARDVATLQGPERVLVLDDTAEAVLNAALDDANPTIGAAIDALAKAFDAPRDDIAADALEVLTDMRDRGFLVIKAPG